MHQEPMMKASDELIMMKNVTIFYGSIFPT